jgi:hypothetical protein
LFDVFHGRFDVDDQLGVSRIGESHVIYCFDTSAINRLLDDQEREPIIQATLSVGAFQVTAYNVIEAAKTSKNADRRAQLIELMRRLANGTRQLDRPSTILLSYAEAHAAGVDAVQVNADEKLSGLWVALQKPDLLDHEAIEEVFAWAKKWEDDFSEVVSGDRDQFQSLFRKAPQLRPRTAAATLRAYLDQKDKCRSLVSVIYKRQTQRDLTDSQYTVLVREPIWPLYLLAYAYAVHQRGIQERNFSANRNAGAIDLGQAAYLPLCDRFVTDDRAQYRGLRLLNVLNGKRRTQVMRYDTFRNRLLAFA